MAELTGRLRMESALVARSGPVLRERRQSLGLDLQVLAGMLGVSRVTLSRWEHGREPIPERRAHDIDAVLAVFEAAREQAETLLAAASAE